MARLNKSTYNLTYHLGTNSLGGDTEISLRQNLLNEDYQFFSGDTALSFSPDSTTDLYALIEIIFDPTGKTAGLYTYACQAGAFTEVIPFTVNVTVIAASAPDPDDPLPPEDDPYNPNHYAAKYIIENINAAGDEIKLEILEPTGSDSLPQTVRGTIAHTYADRKDLLQPIIASSLSIDLEASEDFTLVDLYTEEESKYKIKLSRNNQVIFFGILKPDGIWEDFTTTRWIIQMDAMDGLSILKDLSFVKDNGAPYEGDISQFQAVRQCLRRIGYELPINISADLPKYSGFTGTDTVLKSVLMNADRFYQDAEKDQIMDCETVLKSILDIYSATIMQMNGEWWIYRTIDVKDTMNFYRYYANSKTDVVWNAALEIGSHIDDYEIFHANANQKKSINPSTQAFRVNYKYGTVRELYKNAQLKLGSGLYAEGWYINPLGGKVTRQNSGRGVQINAGVDEGDVAFIYNTDLIRVTLDDRIDVVFNFETSYSSSPTSHELCYSFQTNNFIMSESGWLPLVGNGSSKLVRSYPRQPTLVTETFNLPPIPEDGNLIVTLWIRRIRVSYFDLPFYFNSIDVKPNSNTNYKGEFHTAQRLTRVSSVTKADKTVSIGDSLSDIYYGTLYKDTGEPTETWTRIGDTTGKPLLQIMAEDALRIAPRPMLFFEGNIKGYVPYLSRVLINNVPGVFQISKYSYDTQSDINNTNFREYSTAEITDFRYEFTYDYGNTTKVTIQS